MKYLCEVSMTDIINWGMAYESFVDLLHERMPQEIESDEDARYDLAVKDWTVVDVKPNNILIFEVELT